MVFAANAVPSTKKAEITRKANEGFITKNRQSVNKKIKLSNVGARYVTQLLSENGFGINIIPAQVNNKILADKKIFEENQNDRKAKHTKDNNTKRKIKFNRKLIKRNERATT